MSDRRVKVTDRRMFHLDGELREEFRHLEDESAAAAAAPPEPAPPEPAPPEPAPAPSPPTPSTPRVEGYPDRPAANAPGFLDLIGLLAEPASIYLREASAGRPGTMAGDAERDQNLEIARLHIDLLEVLQQKAAGNLDSQEQAMLDDVIYRLRLGYVQIQG